MAWLRCVCGATNNVVDTWQSVLLGSISRTTPHCRRCPACYVPSRSLSPTWMCLSAHTLHPTAKHTRPTPPNTPTHAPTHAPPQTNSVVLRERSPWIEYYYRSLRHGQHVLEYDAADVLQLLTQYGVSVYGTARHDTARHGTACREMTQLAVAASGLRLGLAWVGLGGAGPQQTTARYGRLAGL